MQDADDPSLEFGAESSPSISSSSGPSKPAQSPAVAGSDAVGDIESSPHVPPTETEEGLAPGARASSPDATGSGSPTGMNRREPEVAPSSPLSPLPLLPGSPNLASGSQSKAPKAPARTEPPTTRSATKRLHGEVDDAVDYSDVLPDAGRAATTSRKRAKIRSESIDGDDETSSPAQSDSGDEPPPSPRNDKDKGWTSDRPWEAFGKFCDLDPSSAQDWKDRMEFERRESGLNLQTFKDECQPHEFMITAHWKSKFYFRLPVWSSRPVSDMSAMDRGEDPYIVSTHQIFEFYCQPETPEWAICKMVVRLALIHAEALAAREPLHEVGSTGVESFPRVFGPVGAVRVFKAQDLVQLGPHFTRNLFGTHHLLVIPPPNVPEPPPFTAEGFQEVYGRKPQTPCDIHCARTSLLYTTLTDSVSPRS